MANRHDKFSQQIATANYHRKFSRKYLAANRHSKFSSNAVDGVDGEDKNKKATKVYQSL